MNLKISSADIVKIKADSLDPIQKQSDLCPFFVFKFGFQSMQQTILESMSINVNSIFILFHLYIILRGCHD